MIKSLYNGYFQKSKIFLYPALTIPRGTSVTPVGTHVSWSGHYTESDCKLMCTYHLRLDKEFKAFEKMKLFGSPYFHDFYEVEGDMGMYIFDFQEFTEDWQKFLDGKYSALSKNLKSLIQSYYSTSKKNFVYVDSYLNPEMYYDMYSKLLNCDKKILEQVVELCDKPDMEKETITINLKELKLSGFGVVSP